MTPTVYHGDCLEVLATFAESSLDACVTDPPYGLKFMGMGWDALDGRGKNSVMEIDRGRTFDRIGGNHNPINAMDAARTRRVENQRQQIWHEAWARAVYRVLKPGAHLVAFGGARTSHRLVCAVEDAGFEIRDNLQWLFGQGLPKSRDIGKAIDKAAGAERKIIRTRKLTGKARVLKGANYGGGYDGKNLTEEYQITAPASDAAKQWDGWGSGLKPAHEPICLARKPFKGTLAENVQRYGTGAINIKACVIAHTGTEDLDAVQRTRDGGNLEQWRMNRPGRTPDMQTYKAEGRWPANLVLDEEAAALLDEQSGELAAGHHPVARGAGGISTSGHSGQGGLEEHYSGRGGASRFFYVAKASRAERDVGGGRNTHPTVKPISLLRWLCRLITPPGGAILDPFMGSGSVGRAAWLEGFDFFGIEKELEYVEIARARIQGPLFAGEVEA